MVLIFMWERIESVVAQNDDVCICVTGDFNSVTVESERVGTAEESSRAEIRHFNEFIRDSGLIDLNLQGRRFTWYRANGTCKSRIDRAMLNSKWPDTWASSSLRGLPRDVSDHCAIVLDTKVVDWGPKPFRFINAWTNHPDFLEVVGNSWREWGIEGWGCYTFKEKLKRLKEKLKKWNKEVFGLIEGNIEAAKGELARLDTRDDACGLSEEEVIKRQETRANLFLHLKNMNSLRAQKARVKWLQDGDINSRFFHRIINGHRKGNEIRGMEINGCWCDEPAAVKTFVKEHFEKHFQKREQPKFILPPDSVTKKLTEASRSELVKPFMEEEIKATVLECDGSKSPGPDGFNLQFFKSCWPIIKEDLVRVCEEFHSNGKLARGSNQSFIVLVPKKEGAASPSEFRPISLIGSLYKVMAKLLAGRIRKVMSEIVSENQIGKVHS